jgi:hypothetical protein
VFWIRNRFIRILIRTQPKISKRIRSLDPGCQSNVLWSHADPDQGPSLRSMGGGGASLYFRKNMGKYINMSENWRFWIRVGSVSGSRRRLLCRSMWSSSGILLISYKYLYKPVIIKPSPLVEKNTKNLLNAPVCPVLTVPLLPPMTESFVRSTVNNIYIYENYSNQSRYIICNIWGRKATCHLQRKSTEEYHKSNGHWRGGGRHFLVSSYGSDFSEPVFLGVNSMTSATSGCLTKTILRFFDTNSNNCVVTCGSEYRGSEQSQAPACQGSQAQTYIE